MAIAVRTIQMGSSTRHEKESIMSDKKAINRNIMQEIPTSNARVSRH